MQSVFRNKTTLWVIVSALCFFVTSSVKSAEATPVKNVIVVMIDGAGATHSTLARSELRDTLSASGVEHAVFWDDAAGIFQ